MADGATAATGDGAIPPVTGWRRLKDTQGVAPFPSVSLHPCDATQEARCRDLTDNMRTACSGTVTTTAICSVECRRATCSAAEAQECYDSSCSFGSYEWAVDENVAACR